MPLLILRGCGGMSPESVFSHVPLLKWTTCLLPNLLYVCLHMFMCVYMHVCVCTQICVCKCKWRPEFNLRYHLFLRHCVFEAESLTVK